MFFVALAVDYDGTLAHNGYVAPETVEALRQVRASGRKLILVTGRELPDLEHVFPEIEVFDLVVAENGALLFDPVKREETLLEEPPPAAFVDRLRTLGVSPLSVGRCIVATWEPNEKLVLEAIRDLGLELHIIFNKGAVMVLPSDVNKASGLAHALGRLRLSPHNVVGIGDAENDQAFLNSCGCAVAVANALPSVKERADLEVADHGAGVVELARMLTDNDLAGVRSKARMEQPVVGERADKSAVTLSPFETVLISGTSGGGKSTIVTALLEQMHELGFQFCVVDPEGDYAEIGCAVVLGDAKQEPRTSEVMKLLAKPETSVVVNLLAIDPAERPGFLAKFLPDLAKLRAETGRPHWIVIDEVHHCLPARWDPAPVTLPKELPAAIAVTVHPEQVAPAFLDMVSTVVGVGEGAARTITQFCEAKGEPVWRTGVPSQEQGKALVRGRDGMLEQVTLSIPKEKQKRHVRKYAEGELGEDKSFYFRGPKGALNLRAQNLVLFVQLAEGVDDATWLHHLEAGEYSRWFRDAVKDKELAAEAEAVEREPALTPKDSRRLIKDIIERKYTAPAKRS